MDTNDRVELALAGRVSFKDTISIAQAAEIIKYVSTHSASPGTGDASLPLAAVGGGADSNPHFGRGELRTVLAEAEAQTNPAKIVAFAAFVQDRSGLATFTTDMVKPLLNKPGTRRRQTSRGTSTLPLSLAGSPPLAATSTT